MNTPEQNEWNALRKAFKKEMQETVEANNFFDIIDDYKVISDEREVTPTRTVQLQNAIYDNEGSIHRQLYARFQNGEAMGTVIDIIQHHTEFPDHYHDRGLTETATKTCTQHIHLT